MLGTVEEPRFRDLIEMGRVTGGRVQELRLLEARFVDLTSGRIVLPPSKAIGYWLKCLLNFVHRGFADRLKRHGISVPQWGVLRSLHDREPASLNELVRAVGIDTGALSRMVERLSQKGLLRRKADAEDRRAVRLGLTDAGRKPVPVLAREANRNVEAFFGVTGERDRRQLLAMVRELLTKSGWQPRPTARRWTESELRKPARQLL